MWREPLQRYLLPGAAERDPGFRAEIERLAHIGLLVIGGVEICVSTFMILVNLLLDPNPEFLPLRVSMGANLISIGVLTLLLARLRFARRFARAIGMISGVVTATVLTTFFVYMTSVDPTSDDFIPGNLTLIMLVAVVAIPMRPTDTMLFGFLMETIYVTIALGAHEIYDLGAGVNSIYVLFIFMLSCLAAALTAVVYDQRRSTYEWHRSTLRAAEDLRLAESRNLLSQNAASVGRLAAALSHELNSPVGALVSGVDTLLLLASRQATSSPDAQQRLVVLQNELRKSIKASSERLREIVARMQRFTNLDKAEVQQADVNHLLADVAALLEPHYKGKAKVELDLKPVPPMVCRPQQLSAVFSNLLGNAVDATNGSGGRVLISSRCADTKVEVVFQDNGRGLEASQVDTIFDPGFQVKHGRVSTGNWSMFSSRQIVREHGGDISIESSAGVGTSVCVWLPVVDSEDAMTKPS